MVASSAQKTDATTLIAKNTSMPIRCSSRSIDVSGKTGVNLLWSCASRQRREHHSVMPITTTRSGSR